MRVIDENKAVLSPSPRRGPVCPRFLCELAVIQSGDEVVIHGSDQLRVFEGEFATGLCSRLIPLLDGSRTVANILECFPSEQSQEIQDAIGLLYRHGLIEDAVASSGIREQDSEIVSFLARHAAIGRWNKNAGEAYQRLRAAHVVICCPEAPQSMDTFLESLLNQSAVGRTEIVQELASLQTGRRDNSMPTLAIAMSFTGMAATWYDELHNFCAQRGIPWLRGALDPKRGYLDVGPLFNAGPRPCYSCFCRTNLETPQGGARNLSCATLADMSFLASLMAATAVHWISKLGFILPDRGFRRFDMQSWTSHDFACFQLPHCPQCHAADAHTDCICDREELVDSALVYESLVAPVSPSPAARAAKHSGRNLAAGRSIPLAHCPQLILKSSLHELGLPALNALRSPMIPGAGHQLTADDLGTALALTGGLKEIGNDGKVLRWAATAGNLGSVELCVVAHHIEGIGRGFYFYDDWNHSLRGFSRRHDGLDVSEFMVRAIDVAPDCLPDALLFFIGAYGRVSAKYGEFGYRLVNFDAGNAVSQLLFVATGLNVHAAPVPAWADDLIESQLNLQPLTEQVTAAVAFGSNSCVRVKSVAEDEMISARPASFYGELPAEDVLQLTFQDSRMLEGKFRSASGRVFSDPRQPPLSTTACFQDALWPPVSIRNLLAKRRSVRLYSKKRVGLDEILQMLYCARVADTQVWGSLWDPADALTFMVIAYGVNGLNPGVYRYDAAPGTLSFIRQAPPTRSRADLFVQSEFASSPAVIWIVADLITACRQGGALGHRRLLLRAGAAAHRLWMSALAVGLDAAMVAGIVPRNAQMLLGFDPQSQAGLLALTLGHAAPAEQYEVGDE